MVIYKCNTYMYTYDDLNLFIYLFIYYEGTFVFIYEIYDDEQINERKFY